MLLRCMFPSRKAPAPDYPSNNSQGCTRAGSRRYRRSGDRRWGQSLRPRTQCHLHLDMKFAGLRDSSNRRNRRVHSRCYRRWPACCPYTLDTRWKHFHQRLGLGGTASKRLRSGRWSRSQGGTRVARRLLDTRIPQCSLRASTHRKGSFPVWPLG